MNAMNAIPTINLVRALFEKHVGCAQDVEHLAKGKNDVFRVRSVEGAFAVKIYAEHDGLVDRCELVAYDRLRDSPFVRRCVAKSEVSNGNPAFAIVEYVEGNTLLELVQAAPHSPSLAPLIRQVADFARSCCELEAAGYGEMGPGRRRYLAWPDFVHDYLTHAGALVATLEASANKQLLETTNGLLLRALDRRRSEFLTAPPRMVPIDLNLANFLVTEGGTILALDLENFWGADPLLAVGEWAGHTFGMPAYEHFLGRWGALGRAEERAVRFYALLSNFDVLYFITKERLGDPREARPWGNEHRFYDLIAEHSTAITRDSDQ